MSTDFELQKFPKGNLMQLLYLTGNDDARQKQEIPPTTKFHKTQLGEIHLGNSLALFRDRVGEASVDLIVTSPPFGLVRRKDYGDVEADKYVEWFRPFAAAFKKALKPHGSLVIDIGGSWIPGQPTKSLYQYELLISLCKEFGFHLAQEFFWWNQCGKKCHPNRLTPLLGA